ncbi:MAG: hypothetical protein P8126_00565 [Gammaproteobacteria bacterium]|jgi:hypothetical protein
MSEWTDQIAEFQQAWVSQQQQLLTDWLGNLQKTGSAATPDVWRQAVDIMEQQVNSALDAQKRSLTALSENAGQAEGMPEAFAQWSRQLEEGIEEWTKMQQQLWQVWFDMFRAAAPREETPAEALLKNWQDMAQRAMTIQEQWLSDWTAPASGGKAAKKPAKPPGRSTGAAESGKGKGASR